MLGCYEIIASANIPIPNYSKKVGVQKLVWIVSGPAALICAVKMNIDSWHWHQWHHWQSLELLPLKKTVSCGQMSIQYISYQNKIITYCIRSTVCRFIILLKLWDYQDHDCKTLAIIMAHEPKFYTQKYVSTDGQKNRHSR